VVGWEVGVQWRGVEAGPGTGHCSESPPANMVSFLIQKSGRAAVCGSGNAFSRNVSQVYSWVTPRSGTKMEQPAGRRRRRPEMGGLGAVRTEEAPRDGGARSGASCPISGLHTYI